MRYLIICYKHVAIHVGENNKSVKSHSNSRSYSTMYMMANRMKHSEFDMSIMHNYHTNDCRILFYSSAFGCMKCRLNIINENNKNMSYRGTA